jgi:hypothetical protein
VSAKVALKKILDRLGQMRPDSERGAQERREGYKQKQHR